MNKKKIILILIALAIFGGIGFYARKDIGQMISFLNKEEIITKKAGEFDIKGSGDFTIEDVNLSEGKNNSDEKLAPEILKAPDLNRKITISVAMTEEAKKILEDKIKEVSASIRKDPTLPDNWLELGRLRSSIGDYEGARLCWEYLAQIRPENFVPFNNLGELYGYYLKNYQKAEENYAKAVEKSPENILVYRNVYEFYRFVLKDDAKARAILQKGIAANPGETSRDLQNLLQNY